MILSPVLRQRFFDLNGDPLAGGKVYSYAAGTLTPVATYSDSSEDSPNTNPVELDAAGEADIWLDPSVAYKIVVTDADDAELMTIDDVSSASLGGVPQWNANANYSEGSIARDSGSDGLLYVSLTDENVGNPLSDVTNWRMFDGKVRTVTANADATVADNLIRSNSTSGNIIVTAPLCASTPVGKRLTFKDVGSGGYTTSLKGSASDPIDGANTYQTPLGRYDSVTIINSGTSWDVI